MIAPVAEKGEDRGRVVLQIGPGGKLSAVAVEAAVRVAQAFGSEVEGLFVEDAGLAESARFSFVREVSFSGRDARPLSLPDMECAWRAAAREMQIEIADAAGHADVPVHFRTVRDSIEAALARACAESGPWNLVAIGEPLDRSRAAGIGGLLSAVQGTTGILIAGAGAKRLSGPVVALVETIERVPPMWRAAERIAAVTGADASLLIISREPSERDWIEGQARLALSGEPGPRFSIAGVPHAEPAVIAELLRRTNAGLVIAQYGGLAVPTEAALSTLAATLDGAILMVR